MTFDEDERYAAMAKVAGLQALKITEQGRRLLEADAQIAGLQEWIDNLQMRVRVLESAVRTNHEWHKLYDELDGYPGSAMEQINHAALYGAEPSLMASPFAPLESTP